MTGDARALRLEIPADACEIAPTGVAEACPAVAPSHKFEIIPDYANPDIPALEAFLAANGVGVAGIEVIENAQGERFVYDVNTNTNYISEAEARAGVFGMRAIARHLHALLLDGAQQDRAAAE
ncbi:MAG: hypothetical protein MEP57_08945 [Microvirga sp.]|nr:hypothetical protein [Microvirga sp.]